MLSEQETCHKQSNRSHRHGERFNEIIVHFGFIAAAADLSAARPNVQKESRASENLRCLLRTAISSGRKHLNFQSLFFVIRDSIDTFTRQFF
jgi:hypothetical protein